MSFLLFPHESEGGFMNKIVDASERVTYYASMGLGVIVGILAHYHSKFEGIEGFILNFGGLLSRPPLFPCLLSVRLCVYK